MTQNMFCMLWLLLLVTSPVLGGHLTNDGWDCGDGQSWGDEEICNGYDQCDDNSDEGTEPHEGCNLYPESGCPSYQGIRRWRCKRSGRCYDKREAATRCEESEEEPSRECRVTRRGQELEGWTCGDGRCVERTKVRTKYKKQDEVF